MKEPHKLKSVGVLGTADGLSTQLEFTQSVMIIVFLDDLFSSSSSMDK